MYGGLLVSKCTYETDSSVVHSRRNNITHIFYGNSCLVFNLMSYIIEDLLNDFCFVNCNISTHIHG